VFKAIIFDCDGVLVDSEVIALKVEMEMLAEQGLTFERSDYVNRFMGLSTDAFHAALDEEAQRRLGRPIAEAVRQSERLRAVMVAELTEVPGAVHAMAGLALPKAIASSGSVSGLERKLKYTGLWDHFVPHVWSRPCHPCQAGARPVPARRRRAGCRAGRVPGAGRQRERGDWC